MRVIHGHFSPARLTGIPNVCRAVLLRDPLERLQSHFCYNFQYRFNIREDYRFFRRPEFSGRRQFDLECFSQWVLFKKLDNYQTRFLVGDFENPVDGKMLQQAEAVLRDMHIVGTSCALTGFLEQLSCVLDTDPLGLRHVNPSDRRILHLSAAERQAIVDRFLPFDQQLFQKAIELSARTKFSPILRQRPATVPQARTSLDVIFRNRTAPELIRRTRRSLFSNWRLMKTKARSA